MHGVQVSKIGGPEVLVYAEIARPSPKAGEVLIAVEAIGVNFIDVYFREGRYFVTAPVYAGTGGGGDNC